MRFVTCPVERSVGEKLVIDAHLFMTYDFKKCYVAYVKVYFETNVNAVEIMRQSDQVKFFCRAKYEKNVL